MYGKLDILRAPVKFHENEWKVKPRYFRNWNKMSKRAEIGKKRKNSCF